MLDCPASETSFIGVYLGVEFQQSLGLFFLTSVLPGTCTHRKRGRGREMERGRDIRTQLLEAHKIQLYIMWHCPPVAHYLMAFTGSKTGIATKTNTTSCHLSTGATVVLSSVNKHSFAGSKMANHSMDFADFKKRRHLWTRGPVT